MFSTLAAPALVSRLVTECFRSSETSASSPGLAHSWAAGIFTEMRVAHLDDLTAGERQGSEDRSPSACVPLDQNRDDTNVAGPAAISMAKYRLLMRGAVGFVLHP